jgi:hypothetical protein
MRRLGKRGSEAATVQMLFVAIGLLLALILCGSLIKKVYDDVTGTTFEKNYVAREIALSLDALYASPGDIEYNYSLETYNFAIIIRGSGVYVKNDICEADGAAGFYEYFDGGATTKLGVSITPDDKQEVTEPGFTKTILKFSKKAGVFKVIPENGDSNNYNPTACTH